jgi:hypothetical protein
MGYPETLASSVENIAYPDDNQQLEEGYTGYVYTVGVETVHHAQSWSRILFPTLAVIFLWLHCCIGYQAVRPEH